MKKIISSAFIILLTIGAAQAQTDSKDINKGHRKEQKVGVNKMNLTNDQKSRLEALREEHKKENEAVKKNTSLSAEAKESRIQELRQQYRNKYEAILTPEQREQQVQTREHFKNKNKSGKTNWSKGSKGRVTKEGTGGIDRNKLEQDLDLTAEQQQKVSSIRSSYKPRFEALRGDSALTEEQKRSKMRELMKEQQNEMKAVLTAEQIQRLEAQRGQYSKRKNK
jgi:Spy/CpxP family protein refolding chaperone